MNLSINLLSLFPLHLFTTLSLFILCFLIVVAIKVIIMHLKKSVKSKLSKYFSPPIEKKTVKPKPKSYKKPAKVSTTFKSIEINPNEIDRIYVKRSS